MASNQCVEYTPQSAELRHTVPLKESTLAAGSVGFPYTDTPYSASKYSKILVFNNMLEKMCDLFGLEHTYLSEVLRSNSALMIGSAALACILNEDIALQIDIYVETNDDFVGVNDYILTNNYIYAYNEHFNFTGLQARLQTLTKKPEKFQIFTYKLVCEYMDRYINVIYCSDIEAIRSCIDIAISQCAYDGTHYTVPNEQLPYLIKNERVTWFRFDTHLLSQPEQYYGSSYYEYHGFKIIENPVIDIDFSKLALS